MGITIGANQVQDNISLNASVGTEETKGQKHVGKKGTTSIYAGNLNLSNDTASMIEQKKKYAQKQAMKLIGDAWDRDDQALQNIEDMRTAKADKAAEILDLKSKMNNIENEKKNVQEEYGIDPDSQEQKDLELLEKYQNNVSGVSIDKFSQEEIERLKQLQNMPRTEYQNKVLQLNGAKNELDTSVQQGELDLMSLTSAVNNAKTEQAKSQDMLKADDAADQIMDAANDEAVGMLIKDGMETIEEKQEEEQEKAEEAEKKQEEQDEKLQEAKENRQDQQEIIEGNQKSDQIESEVSMQKQNSGHVEEAQKNIQRILVENNLINEDLKGIQIDFNF